MQVDLYEVLKQRLCEEINFDDDGYQGMLEVLEEVVIKRFKDNVVEIDKDKDSTGKDELWCEWYDCPKCRGNTVARHFNYCPDCGSKINWIEGSIK